MIEDAITCYGCNISTLSMIGCTVSGKIYQCNYCGFKLTDSRPKPKPDPKPLTIKKAIKYLRKHPEVDSMTLVDVRNNSYYPSDVLFEYSTDINKYIIAYDGIFEKVPIYKSVYIHKLKISLTKENNK